MKRRILLVLAALLALALSVGCFFPSGGGGSYYGTGTLIVQNHTGSTIHRVHFSTADDRSWGPDRLGSSETIHPGASRAWSVPAGRYNVRVVFGTGEDLDSLEVYDVYDGGSATCTVRGE